MSHKMSQVKDKDWYKRLKTKNNSYLLPKTKIITTKNKINPKILVLFDEKAEVVNQLSGCGLIVLDRTILDSFDNKSISEQGIISSDFFKARIVNVNDKIIKGVYFHLVKVISGIIAVNPEHQITLEADERFNKKLFLNKLAAKIFILFLEKVLDNHKITTTAIDNKIKIDESQFQVRFNKKNHATKELIFEVRNLINTFLNEKKLDYQKYPFLENTLTKIENKNIFKLEKIEVAEFAINRFSFIVNLLVGKEHINTFFLNAKKDLSTSIKVINKKIKTINNEQLISQFYFDNEIQTYEEFEKLKEDYLKLKSEFATFQKQNSELMKNFLDQSIATHYSEKIFDNEIVHISFNNFLIDKKLLEAKAQERLVNSKNKILFLSNNNFDNSLLFWKISSDLINIINLKLLVKKFASSSFIKVNDEMQDSIFIESNNYQAINDFIQSIINFLKSDNNATNLN